MISSLILVSVLLDAPWPDPHAGLPPDNPYEYIMAIDPASPAPRPAARVPRVDGYSSRTWAPPSRTACEAGPDKGTVVCVSR